MKAAVFIEPGRIILDEKPIPDVGPLDALVRITTTTICGTDVHILKGEYPVARGLTIGHEPVGVIEKLGSAVEGFSEGQRVIAGAICTSGHSAAALCGCHAQDGPRSKHGFKPLGGWRFGNTIDGTQAEYVLVPDAMANLAGVPDISSRRVRSHWRPTRRATCRHRDAVLGDATAQNIWAGLLSKLKGRERPLPSSSHVQHPVLPQHAAACRRP
jgi:threonine dehydrogenase-like Zn-dependent dehydrogenase